MRAAIRSLVVRWLSREPGQPRVPMHLGTIEALKSAVASTLGMSIVPQIALTGTETDIVTRPLDPPLTRTIALIEHRSKPMAPALDIARAEIMTLREGVNATSAPSSRQRSRSRAASVNGK